MLFQCLCSIRHISFTWIYCSHSVSFPFISVFVCNCYFIEFNKQYLFAWSMETAFWKRLLCTFRFKSDFFFLFSFHNATLTLIWNRTTATCLLCFPPNYFLTIWFVHVWYWIHFGLGWNILLSLCCMQNFPCQEVERHNKPEVELKYELLLRLYFNVLSLGVVLIHHYEGCSIL